MKELTCREFDEAVHGFVRMELLDVSKRDAMLEHTAHCAACAERMADAMALAEATEAMRGRMRDLQTPPQAESALLFAFRAHHQRASWRRTLEWATAGAAAAVLLIFLWTMTGRSKGQPSPAPRKDVSSESREPVDAKAAGEAKPVEVASQMNADESGVAASQSYTASDFIPVPFTGGISSDDPGMIVRVQLTRASLAQLGYPIAETPDEDLIRADVLVGEDGWPRGVKLVQ
jgi:hypothetical protein